MDVRSPMYRLTLPEGNKCPSASPFERNSSRRCSTGTLKHPRLPRSDRFRFISSSSENLSIPVSATSTINQPQTVIRTKPLCYPDFGKLQHTNGRTEHHRRKPIIPISKQTCRVLYNTNVELSADTLEYIQNETAHIDRICMDYINTNPHNTSLNLERSSPKSTIGVPVPSTYQDVAVADRKTVT